MSATEIEAQEPPQASEAVTDAVVIDHEAGAAAAEELHKIIPVADGVQSAEASREMLTSEIDQQEATAHAGDAAEDEFMTPMTRNRSLLGDEPVLLMPLAAADATPSTEAEAQDDTDAVVVAEDEIPKNKGKGRAAAADDDDDDDDDSTTPVLETAKLQEQPGDEVPPSPVPSSKSVTPPPEVRYALPIGGGRRSSRRKNTLTGRLSVGHDTAGPSNSVAPATARGRTVSGGSVATIREARNESKPSAESIVAEEARFRSTRRMSASDIPRFNEDAEQDDFVADPEVRKRAHTISIRDRKTADAGRPMTAPAEQSSFAIERPAELHKHATSSSLSSFMIDGQMFTLGDEKRKTSGVGPRSMHARSEAHGASLDYTAGESSHDHGVDSMMFYDGQMRNPVAARDEPMIYDEEDLDDIPPQGSYAIHPPSRRRLAEAADLSLYDEEGTLVKFGTLFESQRTLIIFLRHWFCPFCQMFAQSIQKIDPLPLQRANLGMVVIGQGHWHVTKSYKEVMKMPSFVRMYADPSRKIYTALGMTLRTNDAGPACTRPEYQTMGVLKASLVAIKKGVIDMPIRMPGDVKLLGGEFILGPGLQCSFTHRMVTVRGHLDLPRVLSQAGCDLTLKTPKDVLAERDSVTKRRPQSTRSVDRNTARRIAKRIARRARPATPKDALLAKSQRAAAEAAAAGQDGDKDGLFNSLRGAPPPLPKTVVRSISKRFGSGNVDTDARDGEGYLAGVDGTTLKVVAREGDDAEEADEESSAAARARKALSNSMQTGFSRTAAASSAAATKTRRAAQSVVQQDRQTSLANGITSDDAEWADETPAFVAPPIPRTSSADAFEAASARQRTYNEEIESLRSDAVVGARSEGHRSTASLGRSISSRARNGQSWRRRHETGRPLTADDPSLSSPDLHGGAGLATVESDIVSARQYRSNSQGSGHGVPITLPMGSAASSASSHTMAGSVDSSSTLARNNAQGVPLSVFEQRIKNKPRLNLTGHGHSYSTDDAASLGIAISPRKSSMRYLEAARNTPLSPSMSSMSAPFGEDTDYKRLSPSKLEEPAVKPDSLSEAEDGDDAVESTPKSPLMPLQPHDGVPPSARMPRDKHSPSAPPQNRVSIMALLPHYQDSPESEAPPPVPPKSPPHLHRPTQSLPSEAEQAPQATSEIPSASAEAPYGGQFSSRAPMPAPTAAFASVLANEAAIRNRSQASLASAATSLAPSGDPSTPIASPTSSAFAGVRPLSFAGPALFAGVPSLRAASSVPQPMQAAAAQPPPQPSPDLPSEPATPTQERPYPAAAPLSSGNPLQAFALKNARNAPTQATSVNASAVLSPPQASQNGNAASFLDDLETVDGFRSKRMSESNDSALAKSPNMDSSVDGTSNADYDDDDEDDGAMYRNDWAPLQARHNAVPAQPKSANGHASQEHNASSRGHDDEEDLDWSGSDTQDEDEFEDVSEGGSQSSHNHQLALLGVLSEGRRGSGGGLVSPGNGAYVVKRVISRPLTAPSLLSEKDSRGGTMSASARKVQLNAARLPRKPQTANPIPALSNADRRLTSFREEEEEEQ